MMKLVKKIGIFCAGAAFGCIITRVTEEVIVAEMLTRDHGDILEFLMVGIFIAISLIAMELCEDGGGRKRRKRATF